MGLIFGGAYIRRGLCTEGNLRFKIDWASLIVGSKFTVFALFYFVFKGNFPSTSHRGGLYLEGRFNGGFFGTGLGAYIWRGSFLEFYGIQLLRSFSFLIQLGAHTCRCHVTSLIFSEGHIWGWGAGGGGGWAGGRDSHIRVTEMPVVSLMGVNCRIWFHLGCLGRKVTILAHLHS